MKREINGFKIGTGYPHEFTYKSYLDVKYKRQGVVLKVEFEIEVDSLENYGSAVVAIEGKPTYIFEQHVIDEAEKACNTLFHSHEYSTTD